MKFGERESPFQCSVCSELKPGLATKPLKNSDGFHQTLCDGMVRMVLTVRTAASALGKVDEQIKSKTNGDSYYFPKDEVLPFLKFLFPAVLLKS